MIWKTITNWKACSFLLHEQFVVSSTFVDVLYRTFISVHRSLKIFARFINSFLCYVYAKFDMTREIKYFSYAYVRRKNNFYKCQCFQTIFVLILFENSSIAKLSLLLYSNSTSSKLKQVVQFHHSLQKTMNRARILHH